MFEGIFIQKLQFWLAIFDNSLLKDLQVRERSTDQITLSSKYAGNNFPKLLNLETFALNSAVNFLL